MNKAYGIQKAGNGKPGIVQVPGRSPAEHVSCRQRQIRTSLCGICPLEVVPFVANPLSPMLRHLDYVHAVSVGVCVLEGTQRLLHLVAAICELCNYFHYL